MYLGGKLELWKFVNTNGKKYVYTGYSFSSVSEDEFKHKLKLVLSDYDLDFNVLLEQTKSDPDSTNPHLLLTYNISNDLDKEIPLHSNYREPFSGTVFIDGKIKPSVLHELNKKLDIDYKQKIEEHNRIRNCIIREIKRVNPKKGNNIILVNTEDLI
jgi:hypothetical protein